MSDKILIVDDEADLRSTLADILRSRFSVLQAPDGAAALDLIKQEHPRLMYLDMSMPGMDGLEVLAAAKALDPALIVVMLTSEQNIDVAAKALKLGATEFVTKPFDVDYIRAETVRLMSSTGKPSDGKPWRAAP